MPNWVHRRMRPCRVAARPTPPGWRAGESPASGQPKGSPQVAGTRAGLPRGEGCLRVLLRVVRDGVNVAACAGGGEADEVVSGGVAEVVDGDVGEAAGAVDHGAGSEADAVGGGVGDVGDVAVGA